MTVLSVRYHGNQGAWNLVSAFQSHCLFTWHNKVHFPLGNVTFSLEVIEILKHLTALRNWGELILLLDACAYITVWEKNNLKKYVHQIALWKPYGKIQLYKTLCLLSLQLGWYEFHVTQCLELKYCKSRFSLETAQTVFCTVSWTKGACKAKGIPWKVIFEWHSFLIVDTYTCSCLHCSLGWENCERL